MTAGKKMQLEILRIEKWVTENWVNVLTPSGVAKQAKKRTFDNYPPLDQNYFFQADSRKILIVGLPI